MATVARANPARVALAPARRRDVWSPDLLADLRALLQGRALPPDVLEVWFPLAALYVLGKPAVQQIQAGLARDYGAAVSCVADCDDHAGWALNMLPDNGIADTGWGLCFVGKPVVADRIASSAAAASCRFYNARPALLTLADADDRARLVRFLDDRQPSATE